MAHRDAWLGGILTLGAPGRNRMEVKGSRALAFAIFVIAAIPAMARGELEGIDNYHSE